MFPVTQISSSFRGRLAAQRAEFSIQSRWIIRIFLSCWIHFLYFRVYYFEMDNFSDWNLTCKWQLSSEIAMILWNHHLIITYDHDWGIKDNAVKKNECHVTSSPTCYFSSVLNNHLHMKWHRDSLSIETEIACMVRCKNHAFFDD